MLGIHTILIPGIAITEVAVIHTDIIRTPALIGAATRMGAKATDTIQEAIIGHMIITPDLPLILTVRYVQEKEIQESVGDPLKSLM